MNFKICYNVSRYGDVMNTIMIILASIAIGGLILIMFIATYNHFQDYIIRINEAEVNIDSILRKRFDLLNKSVGIIKNNIQKLYLSSF